MNIRIVFLVALIVMSASLLPVAALSDTDKAIIKLTTFSVLDDTGRFNYIKSDIGWDDSINIWYISKKTDQDNILTDLAFILGAYWGICRNYPSVSNLNVFVGTQDNVAGKLYCQRSWMDEVQTDSQGKMDSTSAGLLVMKVAGTFTKTS